MSLSGLSAQSGADPTAENAHAETLWSLAGSIGHSSTISLTPGSGFSYGSATGLSALAAFRDGRFSGKFSAEANILSGSKAKELWLASGSALPDCIMIPDYSSGLFPEGSSPDSLFVLKIDEFSVEYGGDRLRLAVGRLPVTFGQGRAFSPADIFADFDRSGIMPRRKGADVVELSAFPLPLADLRFVAKPSAKSFTAGSYAFRNYAFLIDTGELSFSAAAGAAWSGSEGAIILSPEARIDTGFASLYGETSWHIPVSPGGSDAGGSGSGLPDTDSATTFNAMVGFDTSLAGTVVIAEYGYYGQETNPHRAFASISRKLGEEGSIAAASTTWIPGSSVFVAALSVTIPDILGANLCAGFQAIRIPGADPARFSGWKPVLTLAATKDF